MRLIAFVLLVFPDISLVISSPAGNELFKEFKTLSMDEETSRYVRSPPLPPDFAPLTRAEIDELPHTYKPPYWGHKLTKDKRATLGWNGDLTTYPEIAPGDHVAFRYEIIKKLGKGGNGLVVAVWDHGENGGRRALKILLGKKNADTFAPLPMEVKMIPILKVLSEKTHVKVACPLEKFEYMRRTILVFKEFKTCLAKEIKRRWENEQVFSTSELRTLAIDLLITVQAIHNRKLLHSDIKPGNILIDENDRFYLADFGSVQVMKSNDNPTYYRKHVGTKCYSPPESYSGGVVTFAIDVWGVGVALSAAAFGKWIECPKIPNSKDTHFQILQNYLNDNIKKMEEDEDDPEGPKHQITQLIRNLLKFNDQERITVSKVLEIPYFKDKK